MRVPFGNVWDTLNLRCPLLPLSPELFGVMVCAHSLEIPAATTGDGAVTVTVFEGALSNHSSISLSLSSYVFNVLMKAADPAVAVVVK